MWRATEYCHMKMDLASSNIRDPQVSARGAKYALIDPPASCKNTFTLGSKENPCTTPFGASVFNGEEATRKNIDFTLTTQEEIRLDQVYSWTLNCLSVKPDRFFKKDVTIKELHDILRHPLVKKEPYATRLRCKIDTSGKNAVRCWNADGTRCELPFDLREYKLIPKITLSHIWFMSKECGIVFLCTDLQLLECEQDVCPFDDN